MNKYISGIIVFAGIVIALLVFTRSPSSTTEQAGTATSTSQGTRVPTVANDMALYTSKSLGFTVNIPKSITISIPTSTTTPPTEQDDTVVVKENVSKGIVYLIARSNSNVISDAGEIVENNVPKDRPIYVSSFYIRTLDDWKNIGAVLGALLKESAPADIDVGTLTYKSIEQHPGTKIYTAIFTSDKYKDDKGVFTPLPINFMASFSSEHKKVAVWLVGQSYVFGKALPDGKYKVFDDDIVGSVVFK